MLFVFAFLFLLVPLAIAGVQFFVGKRHADQAAVLWTLAISLETELPLAEELEAVAGTLAGSHGRKTLKLAEHLRNGASLSEALRLTPGVIPRAAILASQVGEQNNALPTAMSEAAVRHAKTGPGAGSRVSTLSFTYPLALILVATLIFSFLMYYIVPKFKHIFSGFGTEMPEFTQQLFVVADVFVSYFYLFALALLPLLAVGVWVIDAYCRGWGESDVPLVGRWFRRLDMPGVLRSLATTVAANRPLDDTLDLLGKEHPRRAVQMALSKASEQSRRGDDCWYALCDAGLLNVREVAALRSAQRVGNLAWALEQIATTIERQISYRWRTVLEVVQPATILGLGLLVGVIEIAFFLPLMGLILDLS